MPKVELRLLIEPALGGGIERNRQSDSHLRADARAAIQNRGQGLATHSQGLCRIGDAKPQGLEAQRPKNLAGVRRIVHAHGGFSQW